MGTQISFYCLRTGHIETGESQKCRIIWHNKARNVARTFATAAPQVASQFADWALSYLCMKAMLQYSLTHKQLHHSRSDHLNMLGIGILLVVFHSFEGFLIRLQWIFLALHVAPVLFQLL